MFNKTERDIARTLGTMMDRSIDECNYNQPAAIRKTAEWIRQDRRFDGLDAAAVAKEAFDAKQHGRTIQLNKPIRTNTGGGTSVF